MSFQELYALRFDRDDLIDLLKERGLLAAEVNCLNSVKHEGLTKEMMWKPRTANERVSWVCTARLCRNTKGALANSFWENTHMELSDWLEIFNGWVEQRSARDIGALIGHRPNTVTNATEHLRRICQSFQHDVPCAMVGGPGVAVVAVKLKKCEGECDIELISEQAGGRSILRHNTGGRYRNTPVNVAPGTNLYCDGNFRWPSDVTRVGAPSIFPGNIKQLTNEAKARLSRQVRGGKCKKAGGHVAEFNFRYCHQLGRAPDDMKDTLIEMLKHLSEQDLLLLA